MKDNVVIKLNDLKSETNQIKIVNMIFGVRIGKYERFVTNL